MLFPKKEDTSLIVVKKWKLSKSYKTVEKQIEVDHLINEE